MMALVDLTDWLDLHTGANGVWYIKRLSGNDTLANNSHQAGPYMPNRLVFDVFPELDTDQDLNPDVWLDLYVDSHAAHRKARLVYYNNRRVSVGGTRNECRITNLGGAASPLLDPESTGSVAVFVFSMERTAGAIVNAWVCNNAIEEDVIEERLGLALDPGRFFIWKPADNIAFMGLSSASTVHDPCDLSLSEIPHSWLSKFPTGAEIISKAVELRKTTGMNPDGRLMARRACEYKIFQSLERAFFGSKITGPFPSIEDFLSLAQTILQSRKSRSGRSLELHIREVLNEERFIAGDDYVHSPMIEGGKKPDFLFPSKAAYDNPAFPAAKLRMLGSKTTVKDRWRQVINEASRIPVKHLITLQEGVSESQFREMREAGVHLVVPWELHSLYPPAVRPHLSTLEGFLGELRSIALTS